MCLTIGPSKQVAKVQLTLARDLGATVNIIGVIVMPSSHSDFTSTQTGRLFLL